MTTNSQRNAGVVDVRVARDVFQMMFEISQLLNTGLDAETLAICIELCERGVKTEALAFAIKQIRKLSQNNVQDEPANSRS